VTIATDEYPIFVFDYDTWQKFTSRIHLKSNLDFVMLGKTKPIYVRFGSNKKEFERRKKNKKKSNTKTTMMMMILKRKKQKI